MSVAAPTLVLSTCTVHWATLEIRRGEVAVGHLTATEGRLLRFLADHPGRNLSSSTLLAEVWGYREGVRSRTVIVTMHRLRGKVEHDPQHPTHLKSVPGSGYRFVPLGHAEDAAGHTNLPPIVDTLVGRDADLAAVVACLAPMRVVSVVGPAGVGKTRLALEAGRTRVGRLVGGVWWASVRGAETAFDVVDRLRDALGLGPSGGHPLADLLQAVARVLRERGPALVVVDNAESCSDAVRDVLRALVDDTPDASWLVTTRASLDLEVEHRVSLQTLHEDDALTLLQLRASSAVDDEGGLRKLVRRLDGLPLALELAASRLPALGTAGLLALLDDRLELLRGDGARLGLREALDLSWDVLDDADRAALAALAGFPDAFALADALDVLDALGLDRFAPDVLLGLVDKSLVSVRPDPGERTYRLLEAVRDHARRRDPEGRGIAAFIIATRRRAARARAGLGTAEEAVSMRWLTDHLEVLRAAAQLSDDPDAVTDIVLASLPVHSRQGRPRLAAEGLARLGQVGPPVDSALRWERDLARLAVLLELGRVDEVRRAAAAVLAEAADRDPAARSDAGTRGGLVYRRLGDLNEAESLLLQAVAEAEEVGDLARRARARLELGVVQRQLRSTDAALATLEQARREARQAGDPRSEAIAIGTLGLLHRRAGRQDQALGDLREARALSESLGDRQSVEILDNNLAAILVVRGETDEALQTYARLAAEHRQRGATRSLAFVQTNLGVLYNRLGRTGLGETSFREALAAFEALGLTRGIGACHCQLARMRLSSGDFPSALQHCDAALELAGREASIRAQALAMRAMALAATDGSPAEALDAARQGVPAEVQGLLAQAERWIRAPGERSAIQRELLSG